MESQTEVCTTKADATTRNPILLSEVPGGKCARAGILSPLRHQTDACRATSVNARWPGGDNSKRRTSPGAADLFREHHGPSGGAAGAGIESTAATVRDGLYESCFGEEPDRNAQRVRRG